MTASLGLAAIGLSLLIMAVWSKELIVELCRLLKSKAAYWDACTREKDGKAGWSR